MHVRAGRVPHCGFCGLSTLPAARVQTSRAGEGCAGQDVRFEWRLDAGVLNDLVGGAHLLFPIARRS